MIRATLLAASCAITAMPAYAEALPCGQIPEGYKGEVTEWPNEPVDFHCDRGITELAMCIFNREGIEWLTNAGPQFVAIADGESVYALTREDHPAYPMIVKRTAVEIDGEVSIQTQGCGYGDKAASDKLMEDYKKLNEQTVDDLEKEAAE